MLYDDSHAADVRFAVRSGSSPKIARTIMVG
jgi:hypothetical protein